MMPKNNHGFSDKYALSVLGQLQTVLTPLSGSSLSVLHPTCSNKLVKQRAIVWFYQYISHSKEEMEFRHPPSDCSPFPAR